MTTGKNSTDSALIIDAMDILYTGRVEGFCLVSSDSDFTRLAARLREAGMLVIGMGEKKTPRPFVTACNEFKFIDKIGKTAQSAVPIPIKLPLHLPPGGMPAPRRPTCPLSAEPSFSSSPTSRTRTAG